VIVTAGEPGTPLVSGLFDSGEPFCCAPVCVVAKHATATAVTNSVFLLAETR
jgi:hypothetical protein